MVFFYVFLAVDALFILTVISVWIRRKPAGLKRVLFTSYCLLILGLTSYLIYNSFSGKFVHYHADYRVFACGEEIELVDPQGLSNKVGSSLLHEQNDGRIHIEGVIRDQQQITLKEFFKVTGGELTDQNLIVVTNDPPGQVKTYEKCNGKEGRLQVFVYKMIDGIFSQTKISNPTQYIPSPFSEVPPGDCIIVEFADLKDKTDKICESYRVYQEKD